MTLADVALYQYALPLVRPLAGGSAPVREGWLVQVTSEAGHTGWGDVAPLPGFSRETAGEVFGALRSLKNELAGRVIEATTVEPEGAWARWLDEAGWPASVRFGVELAVATLQAATRGVPLPEVLTSPPRPLVPLNGLLMGAPEEVLDEARRMREAGYQAVKLKVGRRALQEDIALVQAIAGVLGPGVTLRLDANRAWHYEEAIAFAAGTRACRYAYIEEPLADPASLPALAAGHGMPIALDETLVGLPHEALAAHTYACAVVLKPTLLGGLVPTVRLARRALALGMTPVLSATFESGIGVQALLALAATLGDQAVPAGLDTYRWLEADVVHPRLDVQGPVVDMATLFQTPRTVNTDLLQPVDV